MATIADVLRHLVHHAPGLSEHNRAEFLDAVDEHEAAAAPPEPEAAPEPAPDPENPPET